MDIKLENLSLYLIEQIQKIMKSYVWDSKTKDYFSLATDLLMRFKDHKTLNEVVDSFNEDLESDLDDETRWAITEEQEFFLEINNIVNKKS